MIKIIFVSAFTLLSFTMFSQTKTKGIEIGIVSSMNNDSLLNAFGYQFLVGSTNDILSPRHISDERFEVLLDQIKKLKVPLFACNLFIPGELKVVGTEVNEDVLLAYVEIVLKRAQAAGIKMIIWGSGGSRRVPEDFDVNKAKEQFISIARKIGDVAARYNITLAIENLNRTEVNFITTVQEAYQIVKAIDHKNVRLCVDVYHMLKEEELPDAIIAAKDYIVYSEVAEKEGRTAPGKNVDEIKPYLLTLKSIGFTGKIAIECWWPDFSAEGKNAYQTLREQVDAIFK